MSKEIKLSNILKWNGIEYIIIQVEQNEEGKILIEAIEFEIYKSRYKVTQPFGEGTSYWTEEDIHKMVEDMIA